MDEPCIYCANMVTNSMPAVQCDRCLGWQHRKCRTGISAAKYKLMCRGELIRSWFCGPCSSEPNPAPEMTTEEMSWESRTPTENTKTRRRRGNRANPKPIAPQQLSKSTIQDPVQTPSDDFYYISRGPIEHCPNCYSLLSPNRTSFNITTPIVTSICPVCNLTIYIEL